MNYPIEKSNLCYGMLQYKNEQSPRSYVFRHNNIHNQCYVNSLKNIMDIHTKYLDLESLILLNLQKPWNNNDLMENTTSNDTT